MEYLLLNVSAGAALRPRCAAELVNLARKHWGKGLWRQMDAALFSGRESLWILRPLPRCFVADYALPYLSGRRG